MAPCSIVECSARKDTNHPELTLHRFPRNEVFRKAWLEAIGIENLNPRHKEWYICSHHFPQSNINKTLNVERLHDNTIPTENLPKKKDIGTQTMKFTTEREKILEARANALHQRLFRRDKKFKQLQVLFITLLNNKRKNMNEL